MLANRKNEIIECSIRLFKEKGYMKTSIDDISKALGVTKGAVYYHIQCKEDILYEIHERCINAVINHIQAEINSGKYLTVRDKLEAAMKCAINDTANYLPEVTIFIDEMKCLSKERLEEIRLKRQTQYNLLLGIIEEGIKNKEFNNIDPRIVAFALFGMINWMYKWYKPDGRLSTKEITQVMVSLVMDGLLKE